jgi:8-oxo-dGTP pyrophosphatase MutT (NUDIX family)
MISSCLGFDPKHESGTLESFIRFIDENNQCFERSLTPGHLTSSAMVVDRSLTKIALTLHGKLNIWLQLGGHADGCGNLPEVALREVEEESGLKDVGFYPIFRDAGQDSNVVIPYDLDIHNIPARTSEPQHLHYDVRYLVIANDEQLAISDESIDLRWFTLAEAREITDEPSMHRQFNKLEWLLNHYPP